MDEETVAVDEIIVTDEIVEAPVAEPKRRGRPPKAKAVTVKNLYTSPLCIQGTEIPVGESRDVPGFDASRPIIKRWLDGNIISVVE